jgi:hypothetical protein
VLALAATGLITCFGSCQVAQRRSAARAEGVMVDQCDIAISRPGRTSRGGEVLIDPPRVEHISRHDQDHSVIITTRGRAVASIEA